MKKKLSTLLLIISVIFTLGVISPSIKAQAATTPKAIWYYANSYLLGITVEHNDKNGIWNEEISTGNIYKTYISPSSSYNKNAYILQYALKRYGYSISVDGYYGANTKNIVAQYQSSKGLAADGIAGPATLNSLVWNLKVKGIISY